jgi:hypothetical protein
MAIDILHRWTGAVLFRSQANTMKEAVAEAVTVQAPLRYAALRAEDLTGALLAGGDFAYADFREAKLAGADLTGASVQSATLRDADLAGALLHALGGQAADFGGCNLQNANLQGARLGQANLAYVDVQGATAIDTDLTGAIVLGIKLSTDIAGSVRLTTGETLDEFRTVVSPDLLTAGGHPVPPGAWDETEFRKAPLGVAFNVATLEELPLLYLPRGTQWWAFYEQGLLVGPTGRASPIAPTQPYKGVWPR